MSIRLIARHLLAGILGFVIVFGLPFSGLFGQVVDSGLVGTVTDPSGAAVPKAQVTAINTATGVKITVTADAVGQYRIEHLPVGTYSVDASLAGFAPERKEDVSLRLNGISTVNFSFQLASQATAVQVTSAPAPLDLARSQVQATYGTREFVNVPSAASGAGFLNLSLLGGNVTSPGGVGLGTGPSIGGQRPTNNRFNIEGADNDSYFATGPLAYVSNEAISEFTLLQNYYSPEFGGASGGIFNAVVKSGGNQLHGSIYEYNQNRDLEALDALYARQGFTSPPRFDSNRLGANVGGPIIKNKLFYFGNFEYNPVGFALAPPNVVSAPTAAGYQMLSAMSGISQTNLQILEKYVAPAPTASGPPISVNGTNIPVGQIFVTAPSYQNTYSAIGSLDWDVSDKDQVRGRYILSKIDGIDTLTTLSTFFLPAPSHSQLVSLSEYHNVSATSENEFRMAYSRNFNRKVTSNLSFPGLDAFPTLGFGDLGLTLGPDPAAPSGTVQGELQAADSFSKVIGRHALKAGYEFHDIILNSSTVSYPRGYYLYGSLSEYLQDTAPSLFGERTLGASGPLVGGIPVGFLQNAAYFNDDFRIRPNLTLNLGARYEFVTVPVASSAQRYSSAFSVPGVISFNQPQPSKDDWSPRIGFAYSPGTSGLWSIRGGFSRAFDMPYANIATNTLPTFYGAIKNVTPGTPNFLASGGLNGTLTPGVTAYTPDQNRPYALTYTMSVQRLLGKDYTIEARYLGTKGVHLYVQEQINRVGVVTPSFSLPTYSTLPSPSVLAALPYTLGNLRAVSNNPLAQYGLSSAITSYKPVGNSQYNGLSLQLNKRYSKNFSYSAAYTWSHALDDSTATVATTLLTPRRPQNPNNLAADWGTSMLDRRQRFTFTPVYDFMPFQNRSWMLRNVVGNWSLAATYTYESPEYATVQSNVDSNLNGDAVGDRALVNPNGVPNTGSGVKGYNRSGNLVTGTSTSATNAIVAYVANNPNAQYITAGAGVVATGGRNTFPLDPINNVDFGISKRFSVGEAKRLELGAQFHNFFNHPQFTGGYTNDVYPYRNITAGFNNFLIPSNASFGQYQQFLPSNARWIQIVGRITF